jgi:hypothetical protein
MTREEAAQILAEILLDAGYTRTPLGRSAWNGPDGHPATRADLKGHLLRVRQGAARDPWIPYLVKNPSLLWLLADQAADTVIPARP